MPDNLKFDQNFFKEWVLYDILNLKSLETSYEDICKLIEEKVITESNHEVLFNEFHQKTRNSDSTRRIIEKVFKKKPLSLFIKYRILQDVISKLTIEQSYKTHCEIIGIVDYPEFDYWYYRIYNGERNLDYDRSKDPKPLTFSELPTDVVRKFVEDWSFEDQNKLRKISRGFRNLVDDIKPRIDSLYLHFHTNRSFGATRTSIIGSYFDRMADRRGFSNSLEKTSSCLEAVIKNPKLCLDKLSLNFNACRSLNERIRKIVTSQDHRLSVSTLELIGCNEQDTEKIITCCKPGVLEDIQLTPSKFSNDRSLRIFEIEQWKEAQSARILMRFPATFITFITSNASALSSIM